MDEERVSSAAAAEAAEIDDGAETAAGETGAEETIETAEAAETVETVEADETATPPVWQGADTADKLSYAALVRGVPVEALVDELLRQSGDDGARWASYMQERRRRADDALTDRLAAEFDELTVQVPEVRRPEDVPDEVVQTAVHDGVTLTDAYLRRWYALSRRTAAEQESERRAAAQSAGRLGGAFDEPDPRETAFSRSFRTALS